LRLRELDPDEWETHLGARATAVTIRRQVQVGERPYPGKRWRPSAREPITGAADHALFAAVTSWVAAERPARSQQQQ